MRAFRRLLTGLAALAGIVVLTVGAPLALAKVGGDPLPRHLPGLGQIGDALASPDDGTLFVRLLTIAGWLAWATFTLSVLVEIPARLRGRRAVRLPGLRLQQRVAAALVGAVLAVFLGGTLASAAVPARPIAVVAQRAPVAVVPPAITHNTAAAKAYQQIQRPVYVVKRGDYLGRIAQRFTGDFDRYKQIAALNPRLVRNPNHIVPGWKLVLPVDSVDRGPTRHAAGNLVKPVVKATAKPPAKTPPSVPKQPTAPVTPAPPQASSPTGTPTAPGVHVVLATVAGLAAAGVLAAQFALWRRRTVRIYQHRVRTRRVTQVRYQIPEPRIPTSPAPALVYEPPPPRPGGQERLDAGLRRLAQGLRGRANWAMPDIYAAWHYGGELGVVLTAPCSDPPEPYAARSPDTWSLPMDAQLTEVGNAPALLPGLLTLGTWPEGGELYVDSERTGLLTLTGDPERCDDLLRHLAAEAATAGWADSASVLIAGFGSADTRALGSLNADRVRTVPSVPDALSRIARRAVVNRAVLRESDTTNTMVARVNSTSGSMWTTHVLFVADPWGEHTAALEDLDAQLAEAGRVGVSVVATHPTSTRWSAGVTASGSLDMPWLAFSDTIACQLTAQQLAALSAAIGNPEYAGVPIAGARHRQRA